MRHSTEGDIIVHLEQEQDCGSGLVKELFAEPVCVSVRAQMHLPL